MTAPPNFDPQPMGRDTQPAPAPPRYLKQQIYADPRVFKHIDDHAINEARTNYRNFKDLIWNLIYKKNFNDLEKVRAIFRWMTTKNMYTIMFDSELPGSPEAVLGGFKDGGTTYARIFECLGVYAGLHCMTLSGWAKGVEYRPGNPITSGPINHSWNVILIDGNWQLVDSHWATRYLQSERNTPENLVYEYDDFYFLTEPSQLIYSHCPEDPSCQLLYPARSRAEFEEYPLVKSFFFNVGMQFQQQNQGVLHTRKGILVLSLGYTRPTAFTFKLGYGDAVIETMQGIQLKRYVIQETGENRVSFYLRAPKEGNYFLTIYAQAVGDRLKVENVFKAVCEYKVVCEQAAGDTRPYPQCSDSNWGPGAPVRQYGLVPSHKDAILMAPNGRAEVSFTKTRDTRLYAKLTREGMDEDTLERCVSVREQDDKVFVTIQLPARGEYGLEIYANEPDREGDTFTHVCQYLASYIDRDPGSVYGQAFDKADFTYGQVSGPVIYPSRAGQFANQAGNKEIGGPPGKQVYHTSSQDWDGNTLTHQTYRSETEAVAGGIRTVTQSQDPRYYGYAGHDPNKTTMYSGRPGEDDGLPPPPPELMQQNYNQQNYAAPPGQGYGQDNMDPSYGGTPYGPNGYQGYQGSPADSPYGTAHRRPNDSGVYMRSTAAPSSSSSGPPSSYGVPPHSRPPGGLPHSVSCDSQSSLGSPLGSSSVIGSSSTPGPSDPDIRLYPASPTHPHPNQPYSGPDSSYGSLGRNSPHYMKSHPGVNDPYGSQGRNSPQGTLSGTDSYGSLGRNSPYQQSPGSVYRYPASPLAQSSPSATFMYPPGPLASPRYDSPGPLYSPRHPSSPGPLSSTGPPPQSPGPRYTSSPSPGPYGPGHYGTYHPGSRGPVAPGSYASLPADYRRKPGQSPSDDNKNKGVEVVYVPGGRSPYASLGRPAQKPGGKGKDSPGNVEIIYTPGQKSAPPPTAPKPGDRGDNLDPNRSKDQGPGQGQGHGSDNSGSSSPAAPPKPARMQDDRLSGLRGFRAPAATYESGDGGQVGRPGDNARYVPNQGDGGRGPVDQFDQQRMQAGGQVPLEAYPFGSSQYGQQQFAQRPSEPEKEYQPHEPKVYTSSITIEPPQSFKPVPITQDDSAPKPAPPVVPPKPFKDTRVFQDVDTHAVEVSKEEHKSFRDLVWHLIYARDITNELEKSRAIFLWLCSKDLAQLNFNDVKKGSPEEILINLQRGQTTYAVVYETLCSYAGLHCKTISGYAKGAEYKPGMRFTGEQGQHSWNGVLVEGAWRLVDCHWAARRLVGKKVTPENVRYELDEYYFMPDPHQLIFTHFPDNSSWQLLERPITLTDFENLVPVKSAFFKYGLQILSHREAVIHTNREVTIRVGCPPFKSDMLAFTFTLSYDDGREEYKDIKLNRFGMQEMLDNVSYFTIRPPEQGSYRLILYAKDLTQQSKEGVYGGVCEYEVIAEGTAPSPQPFPPCVHTSWGPGDSALKYTVKPLQRGAIFSTVNGQAEVKFRLPKELRFTAKLKSDKKDEKSLSGYIMHRVVGDLAIFTITAPDADEYGLEIYANDPESDGNSLYHCFQYLLICTEVKGPVESLPVLPPGYLGPQPNFKKLGLSNTSHTDPYLQTESGDIQVSFSMSQPLRMTSQLIYVSQGKTEDFSDYLLQQGRGNNVIFQLKLPKVGMYKFQIYALPFSDSSESLPGVYNYLINCRMTHSTLIQFPKQYGQWKEGCFLHEPLEGQLQANRPSKGSASSFQYYYYKVDVPKANSVAVVIGDDWTQLEQKGSGSWEGEVFMEKHWGKETKAALCANYGTTKASYSTLLEYSM